MRSAFGVEHGISKSFVNGKFVRAVDLSAKQARKVATGGQYKAARGVSEEHRRFLDVHQRNTKLTQNPVAWPTGIRTNPGLKHHSGAGGTIRVGSAKGGRSYVSGQASPKETPFITAHEAEHANVKRSSYRLHGQIMKDPKKLMREEARADYHSYGHYSKHPLDASAYGTGAKALRQAQKNPKKPFFTKPEQKKLAARGHSKKRLKMVSNQRMLEGSAAAIDANTPHYRLSEGKRAKKAFGAYADLQDQMRKKGVKQGIRTA